MRQAFTKNYNGETIKANEVMVPFEYTDLEAEQVINLECIRTLKQGGKTFKVIYKAVDEKWAKTATSALNLIQNEELGHYAVPNSVSMNKVEDDYELNLASTPSAEDLLMEQEETKEILHTFVELITSVIEKAPKIGYAILLVQSNVKGAEFYAKMRLTGTPGNRVRQEADSILKDGLANFDLKGYKGYKSKYNDVYKEEALVLLKNMIKNFR